MESLKRNCFVCQVETDDSNSKLNNEVYLPVCKNCEGSDNEKVKVMELLESLADGLVCGCI